MLNLIHDVNADAKNEGNHVNQNGPINETNIFEWVDSAEVYRLLNISKRTLGKYWSSGVNPYSQPGGKLYYNVKDINDCLQKCKHYWAKSTTK